MVEPRNVTQHLWRGDGYGTLDYSGVSEDNVYLAFPFNYVEVHSIPLGYDETNARDIFAYASIANIEHVIAGSGNDIMYLHNGVMTQDVGLGNDIFYYSIGGFGDGDHYDGDLGDDILDFSDHDSTGFTFDLAGGTIIDHDYFWVATISGIENIFGSLGDDTLIPTDGTNYLNG